MVVRTLVMTLMMTLASRAALAHESKLSGMGELAQHAQEIQCSQNLERRTENSKWNGVTVVLDTNVLLNAPLAFNDFPGAHVIIPGAVMTEINNKKNDSNLGFAARRFSNELLKLMHAHGSAKEIPLKDSQGATITVDLSNYVKELEHATLDPKEKDNQIIATAHHYSKERSREKVVLVSDDSNMQILAIAAGVQATGLIFDWVTPATEREFAMHRVHITDEEMASYMSTGKMPLPQDIEVHPNEFVVVSSPSVEPGENTVGRYRYVRGKPTESTITKIPDFSRMNLPATPKNLEQAMWLDLALDPTVDCVIVEGKGGSGKTFFSMLAAMELMKQKDAFKNVIVARPTVYFGERQPGALPGTQEEKDAPWLTPFIQNIAKVKALEQAKKNGGKMSTNYASQNQSLPEKFDWQPYEYFRGITFDHTLAVLDEIQNASADQVHTILTRVGDGTRMFMMGDAAQVDGTKRYLNATNNGLAVVMSTLLNPALSDEDRSRVGFVKLVKAERSEFADMVSRAQALNQEKSE